MLEPVIIFCWSLLICVFSIPTIVSVAHSKRILDKPNHRKVHLTETPRLGGLAIFAGFITAVVILGDFNNGVQQLISGCLIIFFVGVKDDIVGVSVFKKFFVQILAAGIVLFYGDLRISSFYGLFGIYELEIGMSYAFSLLVILSITNAINLIDGINGLAGTIVIICCMSFGIYLYSSNSFEYSYVAFALSGAMLGFLRYNIINTKVFMGDTGSLLSGFVISVLAIYFIESKISPAGPSLSIGILFIPIFDTARVFIVRIFNGVSPFRPDKNHIHHVFDQVGFSHKQTVLVLAVINLVIIALIINFDYLGDTTIIIALIVFSLLLSSFLELLPRMIPNSK